MEDKREEMAGNVIAKKRLLDLKLNGKPLL